MEPAVIKNILQNVIYFLEHDKSFELRDEPENHLGMFLAELNRCREIAGLEPMRLDKVIPVPSGGQKCRFSVGAALEVKLEAETPTEKTSFKKITRAAFAELVSETFDEVTTEQTRVDDVPVTNYYSDDRLVGSWSKASGWYFAK